MPDAEAVGKGNQMRVCRYLKQDEKIRTRALYEEMFPQDEEAFVDAYYSIKAPCNRILVWEENEELLAMLHLNPYRLRLREKFLDCNYIVAVATRPAYRHQGCMRSLLTRSLNDLYEEHQPFVFLMPANEAYYTPFDFRFMKNEDKEELGSWSMERLEQQYDLFVWKDAVYDWQHIFQEEWETTPLMMRIVHLPSMAACIGTAGTDEISLKILVEDPIVEANNGVWLWQINRAGGKLIRETKADQEAESMVDLKVSIADLGSFLFGAKEVSEVFLEASEDILEKLGQIRVLRKIFINEVV